MSRTEYLPKTKLEKCLQKMIEDGNLPKGSKILSSKDKKGYDYIKTPEGQIIFFTHKFDDKILDKILEGNYRITNAKYNPKRKVVEANIDKKWEKLEPELPEPSTFEWVTHKNQKYLLIFFIFFGILSISICITLELPLLLFLVNAFLTYGIMLFVLSKIPHKLREKVTVELFDIYVITNIYNLLPKRKKILISILNYSLLIITFSLMLNGMLNPLIGILLIVIYPILIMSLILIYYGFVKKNFK